MKTMRFLGYCMLQEEFELVSCCSTTKSATAVKGLRSMRSPEDFKKEHKVLLRLKLLRDLSIPTYSYCPGNGIWGHVGF